MEKYRITGAKVLLPDEVSENTDVLVSDGKIEKILRFPSENSQKTEEYKIVDANGLFLSPGFCDVHQHGGGGSDYMDTDPDAVLNITNAHLRHGLTSVMPTLLSADTQNTLNAIKNYLAALSDKRIGVNLLGINIEGPYLSPEQSGAQKPENIRKFDPAEYEMLYDASEGNIKRWSVAPEVDGGFEFAKFANRKGITLSIAHSNADFDTVYRAFDAGYRHITHFYSCTSSIVRRNGFRVAGIVEAAYCIDGMNVELIADGAHLPKSLVGMVMKLKRKDTVSVITDAMRAAGQNTKTSFLGGVSDPLPVRIEDGVAKMMDGKAFAGSIATPDRLIRTMISFGASLPDAVKMATVNPMRMMNIGQTKGEIKEGFDADLCLFDEGINVKTVFVNGEIKYSE